jgi:solute carrier family 1 (glial high affinity glutamate transporter), member 3
MWLIRLSPIGVLFLVASKMLEMESWEIMLGQLGMYFLTVMIGLFIHGFIVLQLIYFIVTRKLPFRYVGNLSEALATAFATSSRSDAPPLAFSLSGRPNRIEWLLPTADVIRAHDRIIGCVQNEIQPSITLISITSVAGRNG